MFSQKKITFENHYLNVRKKQKFQVVMKLLFLTVALFFFSLLTVSAQQKKDIFRFPTQANNIPDICFTRNGGAIGITDNKSVKVFLTSSRELINTFEGGHKAQILSIDISDDSTYLISGGKDSTVLVWDFKNARLLQTIKCTGIVVSVCISPDNQSIAFGGTDKKVTLINLSNGTASYTLNDFSDYITSLSFSQDGKYLFASSGDKNIRVFEEGVLIARLDGHKDWIRDFCMSSDGKRLISCDDNGVVILWDISDIKRPILLKESKICLTWLLSVDFYVDDLTYVTGDLNGNAKITGPFANYKLNIKSPVNRILFKPDLKYIAIVAATSDKGVFYIEAAQMNY